MYQIIYYYSSIEMLYLKFYKYKFKQTIKIQDSTDIEFVKNGKTITGEDYDFIVYSQNNEKKIMNNSFDKITCVKSDVSFILFNIVMNNTTISLNLFGNNYNYYVSGNVIDNRFLWYFLNKHYHLNLTEPLINYTLNIIDNNVNIYAITYPEYFEITNDGIRIISHECQKITNNMKFDDFSENSDTMSETTLMISDILTNVMIELEDQEKEDQELESPELQEKDQVEQENKEKEDQEEEEELEQEELEPEELEPEELESQELESQELQEKDQVEQENKEEEDQEKEDQVEQESQEANETEDNDLYDFVKETI